ncbi:putative erythromycin esterase [Aspergillus clavatus NRRL 1]|uniref:Erythromycin esterase, putative n=1 Tax=Aspergillus clavatus (strain ATCC 1007 / CBS 513.65 / DSM 816 / NCTC 3887 / NRRL 1 / QM 1276 / 107) TaxID=344612 RepID=A1CR82_ASPCL|nr:erythromycin esterase, putative [Aspergillus clavatus NRRL 1]EAW08153.1 erythromycin esterase, putative [Aspergillus clavatus NRRL 1]
MSQLQELFNQAARPLPPIADPNFASHFDSFGNYSVVLLGDGSHGTSEFYTARAEITKRFIERHGYTMVAVEADWPDAEAIDRYVRQRPGPNASIGGKARDQESFNRFPTWMWRNREMQDLIEWMRDRNSKVPDEQKAGFYGLDLYSMGASIRAVIEYLDRVDPGAGKEARKRYGCLQPWVDDPTSYGLASLRGMADCESQVLQMLRDLLEKRLQYSKHDVHDGEEFHSSEQNAFLVRDAERYYKAMYYSSASSWTLRDTHMFDTLRRLFRHKPANAKAVVWAHNSHCGDARYTSMGTRRNEVNIGQLIRENYGREKVAILGCGTHTGTVAAAHEWDEDMEAMKVRPSRDDSWEMIAHDTGIPSFVIDLRPDRIDPDLRRAMAAENNRLERFIGVIYRPDTERISHYSQAYLHNQFDAYIWFDQTTAVNPLEKVQPKTPLGLDETYPFGL